MNASDVRRRYDEIRREGAENGGEVAGLEMELMLEALEAIAAGNTPRPRLLARAVVDEYRNKMGAL